MRGRITTLAAVFFLLVPQSARAVRWTLGVATELTPIVLDPNRPDDQGTPLRLGVRPVIDLEIVRALSVGVHAPFVVWRRGEGGGAASSGAEAVFGLNVSGRYPILREEGPEEILLYGTVRGGFGTVTGRAGPYYGGALGVAATWLDTGRGLFLELDLARLQVSGVPESGGVRDVSRVTMSLSLGLVFRLGGEEWRLRRTPLETSESDDS